LRISGIAMLGPFGSSEVRVLVLVLFRVISRAFHSSTGSLFVVMIDFSTQCAKTAAGWKGPR
jgi:hypothetical protein